MYRMTRQGDRSQVVHHGIGAARDFLVDWQSQTFPTLLEAQQAAAAAYRARLTEGTPSNPYVDDRALAHALFFDGFIDYIANVLENQALYKGSHVDLSTRTPVGATPCIA